MAARRLHLSSIIFLSLLSFSSSCVRDLEEEQEEVSLVRERRAEACGSLVTKICEKCAYCKCDGGCDGCAKCSSCVKGGVFSRKGPGCRFCRENEEEADCRKRCAKGCKICAGADGKGLNSCKECPVEEVLEC